MLKMVPLSKIKDNPYRNLKRNPIDQNRVDAIEESIDTTEFWTGVYGRELKDGTVEIAFGHHRVEAAKQVGLKEVSVEIQNFSNGEMLRRMSRENLRGDLPGSIEVVEAAVKALASGDIVLEVPDAKTRKDAIRYAPSFVPGKASGPSGGPHPYTADTLARYLGGVYVRKPRTGREENGKKRAQESVSAALAILELEERKIKGFSEKVLQVNGVGPDGRYMGAKKVLEYVADIKAREFKAAERAEKSAEEIAAEKAKQEKLAADIKARQAQEKKDHDELLSQRVKAAAKENAKESKRLSDEIRRKAEAAEAKAEADKIKMAALEASVEAKKAAAVEQRKEDEYLPIRREADRIIHILERRDLSEDLKALSRRPLTLKDRERVWEAIDDLAGWLTSWAAAQFSGPVKAPKLKRRTK
jgi:hypothetical protein